MYSYTIMIISENVDLNYFLDNIQPHTIILGDVQQVLRKETILMITLCI